MNKITFLKNLVSIIWARTREGVIFFAACPMIFLILVLTLGQISLWCGMPPMGSEGMGNALTGVSQFDNGLAVLLISVFITAIPIAFICIVAKGIKEFVTNLRDIIKQAAEKSATIPNNPNDTRTPEQKMIDADRRTFDGNPN